MQHVEVVERSRWVSAMDSVARFDQRPVERPAVEGHQQATSAQLFVQQIEERYFVSGALHKVLTNLQAAIFEAADADQKRHRSGSTCQSRRLRVEEADLLRVDAFTLNLKARM